jgi:hypothetical protein
MPNLEPEISKGMIGEMAYRLRTGGENARTRQKRQSEDIWEEESSTCIAASCMD